MHVEGDLDTERSDRVLEAPEPLDLDTRSGFRDLAFDLLAALRPGTGRLVIDLGATSNVDSAGLAALVQVQRRAGELGHVVRLRRLDDEMRSLLIVTNLWSLFEVE